MNANRYMRDALRTADRSDTDRLKLECALGLCGEAGEVAEQVKKHFFHGHDLDKHHMIEELGDVAWYLAVLSGGIGSGKPIKPPCKKVRGYSVQNFLCSSEKRLLLRSVGLAG